MKAFFFSKKKSLGERKPRDNIMNKGRGLREKRSFSSKGQSALLTKPIVLILTISIMLVLIYSIYNARGSEATVERELDLRTIGTNTILVLANSEQCLAYRFPITFGGYANIVDIERLQFFTSRYGNIEPLCARNFDFGWRANVNEIDKSGRIVKTWEFGTKEFSKGLALRQGIVTDMPIAIRYSQYDIRPGKIRIEVVDGELETLAGFVDKICHQRSVDTVGANFVASHPVYLEEGELCMGFGDNKACKELMCFTNMEELRPGSYYLSGSYNNEVVTIIR